LGGGPGASGRDLLIYFPPVDGLFIDFEGVDSGDEPGIVGLFAEENLALEEEE